MEPRPAATVIVVRSGSSGIEVLMLRRAAASRFAPGFLVFPGGVIEDGDADLAVRWFGDPGEEARACALRELYEETRLLLTNDGIERRDESVPAAELAFDPPPTSRLVEVARWVAPEFLEVRFDAAFYAAGAPAAVEPVPDGIEVDAAWWAAPQEVIETSRTGDAPLMWPTLVTLERLAGCRGVDDALALRIPQLSPGEDRDAPVRGAWRRPEWRSR